MINKKWVGLEYCNKEGGAAINMEGVAATLSVILTHISVSCN